MSPRRYYRCVLGEHNGPVNFLRAKVFEHAFPGNIVSKILDVFRIDLLKKNHPRIPVVSGPYMKVKIQDGHGIIEEKTKDRKFGGRR